MNAIFLAEQAAVLFGVVAAGCLTVGPMFRSRHMILLAQLGAALCFAAYCGFLGIAVAAAVNILGAVQTGAALFATKNTAMNWLGYALICLMAVIGLRFWQGPISGLSIAAMTLIALARMQSKELHLRGLLLAGGCFWLVHDFIGEAWIAFAAGMGAVLVGAAMLVSLFVRITVEWRPAPSVQAMPSI